MLSITIMAFQWVPHTPARWSPTNTAPGQAFQSRFIIKFSEVPIVAWQTRNICYSCPMGINTQLLIRKNPAHSRLKTLQVPGAKVKCIEAK